jgi:zinc protease
MGTPGTIGTITVDDLKAHHLSFYSPSNMIISIASNLPVAQVKEWVDFRFGRLAYPETPGVEAGAPEPILESRGSHTELEKEQIAIYLGGRLPGASDEDATAIQVATTILSNRLYLNLREKQGLAYSIGAGSTPDKDFGWFYTALSTASENYRQALDGIILQIEKLKFDGPTAQEVESAKNQLWGWMMRARLSSINQAYYLGVNRYLGLGQNRYRAIAAELATVGPESIRRVASRYFRTDAYILTTAGKRP